MADNENYTDTHANYCCSDLLKPCLMLANVASTKRRHVYITGNVIKLFDDERAPRDPRPMDFCASVVLIVDEFAADLQFLL